MEPEQSGALRTGVAIIGASHAGVECAWALRAAGYTGSILLLGAEPYSPYQRPPLSKGFLAGATSVERIVLRSAEAYEKQNIDCIVGDPVVQLDATANQLRTESGREVAFEYCVIATGARARTLPSLQGPGVYCVRTLDDSTALRACLEPGFRLLVIGGGYLGLEAAATAAKLGAEVSVFEHAPALMSGKVSSHTASEFESMHCAAGAALVRDARIANCEQLGPGWRLHLADGSSYEGDAVLVSVGAVPNTELALDAGLKCDQGIVVDEACRTSAASTFAIGDCASSYRDELGLFGRIESVQNALDHARIAAAAIVGREPPSRRAATFWSEQHGRRLQIAGLANPSKPCRDRVTATAKGWLVERYQDGLLAVVEAVDSPVEFVKAMKNLGSLESQS